MIKEYILKIKPRYVLLMTGVNDVELDQPDEFDRMNEMKINTSSAKLFLKSLVNHTELGRSFLTYYQLRVSYKKGLIHREINLNELIDNPVPDSIIAKKMDHQTPYLNAYHQRIEQIITTCRQAGITPVLITQPSLYGSEADPVTHSLIVNKWITMDPNGVNCSLIGIILEVCNDVLRSFSQKVPV